MKLLHVRVPLGLQWLVAAATLLLLPTLTSAEKDDIVERSLLLELYEATGGPSWNDNRGWGEDTTTDLDYCDWHGVICVGEADLDTFNHRNMREFVIDDQQETYKVMGLDLKDNFLNGRTPASLWKLPLLQYINFNQNSNLQVDFANVQDATQLSIVKVQFTATTSLAGLEHASATLNVLQMSGCPLRSELPMEILALTNLHDLQLAKCQLQGTLEGLEVLSNLRELNLFDNALKGSLPNTLIQLTRLQKISVSRNQLTGNLGVVDAWTNLQQLYLAENQFAGTLPTLSSMERLQKVYLNQNSLHGIIPPKFLVGIIDWDPNYQPDAPIITVDLSRNQLTGEIPGTLADLEDFSINFDWQDNMFTNISQDLCEDKAFWNMGAVRDYGCDGIACPPGSYSPANGRASRQNACHACMSAEFYGQTTCVQENDMSALMALYEATDGDKWYNNSGWRYAYYNLDAWGGDPSNTDAGDICNWYGVSCWDDEFDPQDNGRVRVISLENNNLVGTLPEDLLQMEYLHTLNVARNYDLVVPLTQIRHSNALRSLDISQTSTVNFDGLEQAPNWFAYLIADGLALGGTLPTQILNVTSLKLLSLAECELIGSLPTKLGNLVNLNELYLYDNHLRGSIPSQVGRMRGLRMLSLAENQLTGTLPHTLDNMQNLEALSIANQITKGGGITGPLTTFRFHPFLKNLQLSQNYLEGTVPVQLLEGAESLDAILKVNLAHNRLTGQVPGGLARFPHMDLSLQGNRFTSMDERLCENVDWMNGLVADYKCNAILCPVGTAREGGRQQFDTAPCQECPPNDNEDENGIMAIANKWMGQEHCQVEFSAENSDEQSLVELLFRQTKGEQWVNNRNWLLPKKGSGPVHVCDWYGISCDESKSIVSITLGSNNLQGTFPTELYMLPKLELLSLFGNTKLEFSLVGIENAQELRSLVLDNTGLLSLKGIGQARSLTELNVQNNALSGPLPEELARLINLKSLSISKNSLEGQLPYWLNNLPALETFLASHNQFDGTLPDFSTFKQITYIDLSNNKLTGEIPLIFLKSVAVEDKIVVDLSNNQLEGAVPRELVRLQRMTIHLQNNHITEIDRELCNANGWNDFDVEKYGCDGILCPIGTSSKTGRQTSVTAICTECPKAKQYMGSTACYQSAAANSKSGATAAAAASARSWRTILVSTTTASTLLLLAAMMVF